MLLGYCTNVHAGADLKQTQANLSQYAIAVKEQFQPSEPMGVGLWLSAQTARRLIEEKAVGLFGNWLGENGLIPYTLNGFPFGDFHQEVVQHQVYLPAWDEVERFRYTKDLINILHEILPAGRNASISTLPIAWGIPKVSEVRLQAAAHYLIEIADVCEQLEKETGRLITLCLEPEPGCVFQRSDDIVEFFQEYLLPGQVEEKILRYLRVCHDVCHAAVMFEPQAEVYQKYYNAGISVGKVQVSSAVSLRLADLPRDDRSAALDQLRKFQEPRYLHQTVIQQNPDATPQFYDNLPDAFQSIEGQDPKGLVSEWRVHFHVPIYLTTFDYLNTTQPDIIDWFRTMPEQSENLQVEVETYAWNVLPESLQVEHLSQGIAQELSWLQTLLNQ
ncbi:Sugar phosphate isomerase/epimerase [Planctomycetales bacterium 10988]|nr:Sugar phosphate isomerase/epimerase [Planctomycetales bacterium 10988]